MSSQHLECSTDTHLNFKTLLRTHAKGSSVRHPTQGLMIVCISREYGLHLFEPRYRFMVRDILNSCQNPQSARRGEPIQPGTNEEGMIQPPCIIHFCLPQRIRPGALACLVQIVWCRTYEQESADVQLMPVAWVRLENLWVRPEYGHLFYAKATRV